MFLLQHTCDTAVENVALDEALLDYAESTGADWECLRLWEPERGTGVSPVIAMGETPMLRDHFVVIGANSSVAAEVNVEACANRGSEIVRRSSGGAAIVAGPGCLMYALVLSYAQRPALRMIDAAHREILKTICAALAPLSPGVEARGESDLAIAGIKFSGNSLRCKRTHLLYHGTLLYHFDLALLPELLREPPRQPNYRARRPHTDFVRNLPTSRAPLLAALTTAWNAETPLEAIPTDRLEQLVRTKYSSRDWNYRKE